MKVETQEREARYRVLFVASVLLAVDDPSLVRVTAQPELQQPFLNDVANVLRLPLTVTV